MIAQALMITGSLLFGFGAGIGVPRVFNEPNAEVRLRMLQERMTLWRVSQPLYGLGSLVAGIGVGLFAGQVKGTVQVLAVALGGGFLVSGALAWCWCLYLRSWRIADFAFRSLPSWPFKVYVLLTVTGIGCMGLALLASPHAFWLGLVVVVADAIFLAGFLRFDDIPPFLFYLLLLSVGFVLLLRPTIAA